MTPSSKHCLLVVDDEADVCDSVNDLLRREFRVLKATSAQEGFRLMQEEEVHIIMTDQRMPRITGVELLATVKARNPNAIRMLFTGYADLESIIAAINEGHVYQFLKKPWQPEDLLSAVRMAAKEYDRLIATAEEGDRLRSELASLQHRLSVLEEEVRLLSGLLPK
ncbi:MAG: response regulator with CheY-like receiver, AAA-type ATPase, and DNA-binding domain [Planctomycetota bacterium]|nr:response regulator with CheY-like receiver, AAA-type ATPase, and DNA-binding domain [Planctomycetota bacterium]